MQKLKVKINPTFKTKITAGRGPLLLSFNFCLLPCALISSSAVKVFLLFTLSLLAATGHAAQTCAVAQDLWDRPRSGRAVLAQATIKPCIGAFLDNPAATLVIHHGTAAEPAIYAEELRAWLGALAVDPSRIRLSGDQKNTGPIYLELEVEK